VSVGTAFIPVDGPTLGFVSIGTLTLVLTHIVCDLVLSAPFFATDEHKALT
jgi:hypothetical protein